MVRLQAEVDELRVLGVVIVLLGLHTRIRNVIDLDRHSKFLRGGFHHAGQIQNGKLLGELVVNAALAFGCRVMTRNLDTSDRIPNVEETARLTALTIDRERLADGRLHAETIEDGAEDVVIIEPIDECFIERGFVRHRSVNDALIEVRGTNAPDLAREHHVVAVVHLREVIEGSGLLRERQHVLAAVVFDGDVALLDVDVRRAVLAHGPQFDEVPIRQEFADGEKDVQCSDDVVDLREDGVLAVNHRVGSRALFREVDHRFRLEGLERGSEKVVVGNVADEQFDGFAGQVLPDPDAIRQRANRSQRLRAKLVVPKAPQKVVNDGNRMAPLRQIESCRPTAIAVPTEHGNLHVPSSGLLSFRISTASRPANDSPSSAQPASRGAGQITTLVWTFFFYLHSQVFASAFFEAADKTGIPSICPACSNFWLVRMSLPPAAATIWRCSWPTRASNSDNLLR